LTSAEKTARLQYLPDLPVHITSEVTLDIHQSLPGLSLATRGNQRLEAMLTVSAEHSDLPIFQPPFHLSFVLKSLQINLRANDEDISFDSKQTDSSIYLSQVSKMVDRPIQLHFGDEFKLENHSEELQQMVKELPLLQEINPESLLIELFSHLFALGGQELTVGKTFQRDFSELSIPSFPDQIEYTVTDIDDYDIYATIKGKIEKQALQLKGLVQINDKQQDLVGVNLSGTMNGKVKWNRDNAMLYDMETDYEYSAKFHLGEWEWMMNVTLGVHNSTKLRTE